MSVLLRRLCPEKDTMASVLSEAGMQMSALFLLYSLLSCPCRAEGSGPDSIWLIKRDLWFVTHILPLNQLVSSSRSSRSRNSTRSGADISTWTNTLSQLLREALRAHKCTLMTGLSTLGGLNLFDRI